MTGRRYTGSADGVTTGCRAGLKVLIDEIVRLSDGGLWNNGDFVVRNMRGKESLSVHATGRAVDLSYRFMKEGKGKKDGRTVALQWCKLLTQHADALGLDMIIDYYPEPYGRAWRCDRDAWVQYERKMVSGAPHGDWLHIELSPSTADDPAAITAVFKQIAISLTGEIGG